MQPEQRVGEDVHDMIVGEAGALCDLGIGEFVVARRREDRSVKIGQPVESALPLLEVNRFDIGYGYLPIGG